MHFKRTRTVLLGIAIAVAVASAAPILSASISAGSISLSNPVANQVVSGTAAAVEWTWRTGTLVKSTTILDVRVTDPTGTFIYQHRYRFARQGGWTFDTTKLSDGAYGVVAVVRGTDISSIVSPIFVDNTLPEIEITQPRGGDVVWINDTQHSSTPIIVGRATLKASVVDMTETTVEWFLDDTQLLDTEGAPLQGHEVSYDFGATAPGEHSLKARATDVAGNSADSAPVSIITLGAGGADTGEVPDPSEILPSETPNPDDIIPSEQPDPCTLVPTDVPNPCDLIPSEDPDPGQIEPPVDPNNPPTAPDPGTLIPSQPPVPLP